MLLRNARWDGLAHGFKLGRRQPYAKTAHRPRPEGEERAVGTSHPRGSREDEAEAARPAERCQDLDLLHVSPVELVDRREQDSQPAPSRRDGHAVVAQSNSDEWPACVGSRSGLPACRPMEPLVLEEVKLAAAHAPTGETRHLVGGSPMGKPSTLRIARYRNGPGDYLLYLDEDGQEQTDT